MTFRELAPSCTDQRSRALTSHLIIKISHQGARLVTALTPHLNLWVRSCAGTLAASGAPRWPGNARNLTLSHFVVVNCSFKVILADAGFRIAKSSAPVETAQSESFDREKPGRGCKLRLALWKAEFYKEKKRRNMLQNGWRWKKGKHVGIACFRSRPPTPDIQCLPVLAKASLRRLFANVFRLSKLLECAPELRHRQVREAWPM